MVFLEYGFGGMTASVVCEDTQSMKWSCRTKQKSQSEAVQGQTTASLEEEIWSLRRQMEDAFLESESLTSETVVGISRLLDDKINEYMRKTRKS